MHIRYLFYIACAASLLLTACEEKGPNSLLPALTVEPASDITRNSACVSGSISVEGECTTISRISFRYGTSQAMEQLAECDAPEHPRASLDNLLPNTTYFYCLEAGNTYSLVRSETLSFTTLPTTAPALGELTIVNKGPVSITLQCAVTDNGGEAVTRTGFRYVAADGTEKEMEVNCSLNSLIYGRIGGLMTEQDYSIYAYACNAVGEVRSNAIRFHTSQSVLLTEPGTLQEVIGENDKYQFSKIEIAGPLNGTDLRVIRDMLGIGIDGNGTPGKLSELNLSDATICAGGLSYDGSRFTRNRVIGQGMFAYSPHLTQLYLPANCTAIEKDAFHSCPLLTTLQIPAEVSHIEPSLNCPKLTEIDVPAFSPYFSASHGVLYNREQTTLLWYPEGKTELTLLSGIERIGKYAFRNCRLKEIALPHTVSTIADGAFYGAEFQQITLPDNLKMIETGILQACRRLTKVVLGKHTEFIANYAFHDCPLQHLYVQTETFPPHCKEHSFTAKLYETCILHVPLESKEIYQNAAYWSNFHTIETQAIACGED